MRQRQRQRYIRIGLLALFALAVLAELFLTFATSPQMQGHGSTTRSIAPKQQPAPRQNAPGSEPSTPLIGCVLNGHLVAGCHGTTTMGGHLCSFTLDVNTHKITMLCHE